MKIAPEYVDQTQNAILNFVLSDEQEPSLPTPKLSTLVTKLLELDDKTVQNILGSIGHNLQAFLQISDLSHPDLTTFQNGMFLESTTTLKLQQVIEAWLYAKNQNLTEVMPLYRKMARQGLPASFVHLRSQQDNQQVVRLVLDPELRDQIRKSKQPRQVQLFPFYKKGEAAWHLQPDNFDMFIAGSKAYEQQIEDAKKKAEHYKSLGCESMMKAVSDSIAEFTRTFKQNNCHGFYRITMTNAAIILAKLHGYGIASKNRGQQNQIITVPDEYVKFFKPNEVNEEMDAERRLIEELERMVWAVASKEGKVPKSAKKAMPMMPAFGTLVYSPMVYPLPLFLEYIHGIKENPPLKAYHKGSTWDLVKRLESSPALGGKPMFDHLLVLVPAPQPSHWQSKKGKESASEYSIICEKETKTFLTPLEARIFLDTKLVHDNLVTPVLLGERDGQCYFLSFWT